jgi:5-carboxyvanillate decarboxylase
MATRRALPGGEHSELKGGINRRAALGGMSAVVAATLSGPAAAMALLGEEQQARPMEEGARLRKIATEEAFSIPEVAEALRDLAKRGGTNLDLKLMSLVYDSVPKTSPGVPQSAVMSKPSDRDALARTMLPRLLDLDAARISDMDANGVDMHLLSLTSPGVQMFDADKAIALARLSNDRLSEAVRRHPTRFAGLACFAPQDPRAAALEMERAINTLKLNGFLVNSHTQNVYLDDPRCWPMLEAAEALGAPIYIHPRAPSDGMAGPFRDYRMEGAIWGYGIEAGTHALRLMLSGVLDRFPGLRIVLGHMGEALPFWLWRLDFMASPGSRAALRNKLKPSEYMQRNFAITTSGVEDPLALRFCIDKIGVDRIMWAIDYPYQPTAPAVKFLESALISDHERAQIAFRNAERVFRITN